MMVLFVHVNVALAIFNMLPIPPADGSRIVEWLLPPRLSVAYASFGRYGLLVLLLLVATIAIYPIGAIKGAMS